MSPSMDVSSLDSGTSGSTLHDQDPIQPINSCVYFKQNDDPTYSLLHMDDLLIVARNKAHIQKLKAQLKKEFDMKNLEEGKKILGMKITRDRGTGRLWLSKENYVLKILEIFNMAEARPVTTPLAGHFKLFSRQCP